MSHFIRNRRRVRSSLHAFSNWINSRIPQFISDFGSGRRRRLNPPSRKTSHLLEALESRTLLSAVTWTGGGDGSHWSDANNWSTSALPGATDDVFINDAANPDIILDGNVGTANVNSLNSSNTLTINGGGTLIANTATLSANLVLDAGRLQGGTITFQSGAYLQATVDGGVLDNATINGNIDMTSNGTALTVRNTLTLNGTATLGAAGAGAGYLYFNDGTTASATLTGNADIICNNASLTNVDGDNGANDGLVTFGPNVTIHGASAYISSYSAGSFVNNGTIDGDVSYGGIGINSAFTNSASGVIKVENGGRFDAGNAFTNDGLITTGSTSGSLNSGSPITNDGTIEAQSGGSLAVNADIGNAGTIQALASSTITLTATTTFTAPAASVQNTSGTVDISGVIDLEGQTDSTADPLTLINGGIRNGTLTHAGGAGTAIVGTTSGGSVDSLTVNGDIDLTSANNTNFVIFNTLTLNGTIDLGSADGVNAGWLYFVTSPTAATGLLGNATVLLGSNTGNSIFNQNYDSGANDGILTIGASVTVHGGSGVIHSNSAADGNGPTVIDGAVDSDVAGSTIVVAGPVVNNGTIKAENASTVNFYNSITNDGTILVDGLNSTINFDYNATLANSATLEASDSGVLNLNGTDTNTGTIEALLSGSLNIEQFLTLSGSGTILNTNGSLTLSGTLDLGGGSITLDNSWNLSYGTLKNGTVTQAADTSIVATTNGGTLDTVTINGNIDITQADGAYVNVNDSLTLNGTVSIGSADGVNAGRMQFNTTPASPGLLGNADVLFGGNSNNYLFNFNYDSGAADGILTIASTVRIHGQNGYIYTWSSVGSIDNGGIIDADVSGGTIGIYNRFTNSLTGKLEATGAGTLNFGYGSSITNVGLIDSDGIGSLITFVGSLDNSGTVEARNGASLSLQSSNTNSGTIQALTTGAISFQGTTTFAGGAALTNNGGTVNVVGIIDLAGQAISPGDSITVVSGLIENGTINESKSGPLIATPSNGTLDNVTVNGDIDISQADGARLTGQHFLTVNGHILIGSVDGTKAGSLSFNSEAAGSTGLSGNATVDFGGNGNNNLFNYNYDNGPADGVLTLASTVTIEGDNGYLTSWSGSTGPIVNNGVVNANSANSGTIGIYGLFTNGSTGELTATNTGTLFLGYGSTVTNQGLIDADGSAATVNASNVLINSGTAEARNSGLLIINGNNTNNGAFQALTSGTVKFYGTTTFTGPGSLTNNAGTIDIYGYLDLNGQTIAPNDPLTLTGGWIQNGTLNETAALVATTNGGALDNLTVNGDIDITQFNGAYLYGRNILTLNGTVHVGSVDGANVGALGFGTADKLPASLVGNAEILFGANGSNQISNYNFAQDQGILTIASTVTIHGQNGSLQNYTSLGSTINHGTINSDVVGGTINLYGKLTNSAGGLIEATRGGTINFGYSNIFTNQGTIIADGSGSLVVINYDFDNSGTIKAQNSGNVLIYNYPVTNSGALETLAAGTMTIYGTVTLSGAGTLINNAGTMTLNGTIVNTGHTLSLTGALQLSGGTIVGGVINESGSGLLIGTNSGAVLDSLTINGNIDLSQTDGSSLDVADNVTLNGTVFVGNSDGSNSARIVFRSIPTSALLGNALILLGSNASNSVANNDNGTGGEMTLGPGVRIEGGSGNISNYYGTGTIINRGDINANVSSGVIDIYSSFTNAGILEQSNGGTLNVHDPVSGAIHDAPTTTARASTTTSSQGEPITFMVSVSPADGVATGAVQLLDGTSVVGSGTLDASGSGTIATSILTTGTHWITASYSGDTNYINNNSHAVKLVVHDPATTTVIGAPSNSTPYATQDVTFKATVISGLGKPTGWVAFIDSGTTLGVGKLWSSGNASFTTRNLAVATHAITAQYLGDGNYSPSTSSNSATIVVQPADVSRTTLTYSSPVVVNQAVTLTASVTGSGPTVTGTVSFYDGIHWHMNVPLIGGAASVQVIYANPGSYWNKAYYNGSFTGVIETQSSSHAIYVDVPKSATVSSLTPGAASAGYGQPVTLTVSVTSASTPAGSVKLYDWPSWSLIGTGSLDAGGTATFTTSSLTPGTHHPFAVYDGNAFFAASRTDHSTTLTISKAATSTSLISSAGGPVAVGTPITFTSTVSSAYGTPTGTVTFHIANTTLFTTAIDANGVATYTTSNLAIGGDLVTAVYNSSSVFQTSASASLVQQVTKIDTSTAITASDYSQISHQPITFSATVSASSGVPTGRVSFYDDDVHALIGSSYLSGGVATYTSSSLAVGQHTIVAYYAGTSRYQSSNSDRSTVVTVASAPASAILSLGSLVITHGQTTTISSLVTGSYGNPTGQVTLYDGSTPLGSGYVDATGNTRFACPVFTAGTHSLSVQYAGNSVYGSITSSPVMLTVS